MKVKVAPANITAESSYSLNYFHDTPFQLEYWLVCGTIKRNFIPFTKRICHLNNADKSKSKVLFLIT